MAAEKPTGYDGMNVYWAARDVEFSPVGNHHFVIMTFHSLEESPNPAQTVTISDEHGRKIHVLCYALFLTVLDWGVEVKINDDSDLKAYEEYFCNSQGLLWDFDFEGHKIPPPQGMDMPEFMRKINDAALKSQDYLAHHPGQYSYSFLERNCATWVNDLLAYVGVPDEVRRAQNDFFGLDLGAESTAFMSTFR